MAELILLVGNVVVHHFPLEHGVTTIGRTSKCDIQLDDQSASSVHGQVELSSSEILHYKDLASTNGSLINGEKTLNAELKHGDRLKIGQTTFKISLKQTDDTTAMVTQLSHPTLAPKEEATLTRREQQILTLIAQDKQRKEIARELNLSPHTVSDYVKRIYKKLGVSSKQEAANTPAAKNLLKS